MMSNLPLKLQSWRATSLVRRTLGLARTKQAPQASSPNSLDAQLDLERDFMRELGRSADYREGVSAFLERPRFVGAYSLALTQGPES